jgi:hypothetical protein
MQQAGKSCGNEAKLDRCKCISSNNLESFSRELALTIEPNLAEKQERGTLGREFGSDSVAACGRAGKPRPNWGNKSGMTGKLGLIETPR